MAGKNEYHSQKSGDAVLVLEDGSVFCGKGFGKKGKVVGEVVFNTAMVGYCETLTDPSYSGQIIVSTYPLIGNYGVPTYESDEYGFPEGFESLSIKASAYVVSGLCKSPSHWRSAMSLSEWFESEGKTGIEGIDTRELTKKLREKGTMLGIIEYGNPNVQNLLYELKAAENPMSRNLAEELSVKQHIKYSPSSPRFRVVLIDCGLKLSILRELLRRSVEVVVVPYNTSFEDIMDLRPDGILISNGPGNPKSLKSTIECTRALCETGIPIFGICLGNQILGLALGANTYKLKYGHRGANQPCRDTNTGKCYITSQNHSFAIDEASLPQCVQTMFVNINDDTIEGIAHIQMPILSVQFHPEARPGPNDTSYLFDRFIDMIEETRFNAK